MANDKAHHPQRHKARRRLTPWRIAVLAILLLLAAPILAYTVLAVRFYSGKPAITTNHAAEIEALHAHHPDDQRSWTILLELHQRWVGMEDEILDAAATQGYYGTFPRPHELTPDHALFPFVAERIRQTPDLLDMAHEAAGKPVIGQPVTFDIPTDSPDQYLAPDPNPANQPPLYHALAPWITHARTVQALLTIDFYHALEVSDPAHAERSIRALASLVRQIRSEPFLVAGLVGARMAVSTAEMVVASLESHPGIFNQNQLSELQTLLLEASHEVIDLSFERRLQQDVLQRVYTPSGRLTPAVMHPDITMFLTDNIVQSPTEGTAFRFLAPVLVLFVGSRDEQETYFAETIRLAEQAADDPGKNYHALAERAQAAARPTPLARARHLFCHALEPAYPHAVEQQIHTQTQLQAAATRLALERFNLAHGHYPDTLTALVPTYLPELPQDPFNPGHPLHYLLRDNQPIIYSVGANGQDNQATLAPPNTRPDDLAARFANPSGPSPAAPEADWILSPPQN